MGASEFRAALVAAGLSDFADTLAAMVEPGVRLHVEPGDDSELPLGATKLGGRPDTSYRGPRGPSTGIGRRRSSRR